MAKPFVLPETQAILDLLSEAEGPPLSEMSPEEMRAVYLELGETFDLPPEPSVRTRDFSLDGIALRVWFPPGKVVGGPVIVYFHGGGWVFGNLDSHAALCSTIAARTGLRVVAVDYRLAPEAPFPAAHDDCVAGTSALLRPGAAADSLEAPVEGLAVAGDSAGGNLAFAVASHLGSDRIVAQLLIYPVADCTDRKGGSYVDLAEGYLLDKPLMDRFIDAYLPSASDRADPRVSPLLGTLPTGLPPTVLMTAGLDPLRDEGRDLAGRIAATGNEVHFLEAGGLIHGLATMRKVFPSGDRILQRAVSLFADIVRRRAADLKE